jgi:integrase
MSEGPLITIFVRHSVGCKYAGDEFTKRCNCKKHLRWSMNRKQHRMKTGSRSWAGAEDAKRALEAQLTGRAPEKKTDALLLAEAIETFKSNKLAQGIKPPVRMKYWQLLRELLNYAESRGLFTVKQALTLEVLTAYRATWTQYKSSYSRAVVQRHILTFVRFCFDAGWIDRYPRLSPIKIEVPETQPLTDEEFTNIVGAAEGKVRTLIRLMRWSGLAIRDASTLRRDDLSFNRDKGLYRIIRERTKTGEPLYVPIPKDVAEELLGVLNGNPVYVFWNKQKADSSSYKHANAMGTRVSAAFTAAGVHNECYMVSHRLRATFAVDLLQKGVPLEHVSKLLGHKSVTTTERHYAKWVKGRQDRLDALVSATWEQ